jgi:hypothetical protein
VHPCATVPFAQRGVLSLSDVCRPCTVDGADKDQCGFAVVPDAVALPPKCSMLGGQLVTITFEESSLPTATPARIRFGRGTPNVTIDMISATVSFHIRDGHIKYLKSPAKS